MRVSAPSRSETSSSGTPTRFASFSFTHEDLLVDLSKERIDRAALDALLALARASELPARREALFTGERVNSTEGRAALHMALRGGTDVDATVDGVAVRPEVEAVRGRFLAFAEDVRTGRCGACDGGSFTDVVHIGIGGSHLGPEMAVRALRPDHDGPRIHFVANVDGADLADTLAPLEPERSLVLVASKTFTTLETMTNARSARRWLEAALGAPRRGPHGRDLLERRRDPPPSASMRTGCSGSGTGWAAGTRCGRRSDCRSRSRSGPIGSGSSSPGRRPWTTTSGPLLHNETSRC